MISSATAASQNLMVSQLLTLHQQLNNYQEQTATQQVSQDFKGIASSSLNLLTFQNESSMTQQYIDNNSLATQQLTAETNAANNISSTVSSLRSDLLNFQTTNLSTQSSANISAISNIQNTAFTAMQDIASTLNTQFMDGYMFSGGKTDTAPVNFPYTSLNAFQAVYTGAGANFPSTRANYLGDVSLAPTNAGLASQNLTATQYGSLSFSSVPDPNQPPVPPNGTITATPALGSNNLTPFTDVGVGSTITISNSASNNLTYTVLANNGTMLTVTPPPSGASETGTTAPILNMGPGPVAAPVTMAFNTNGTISASTIDRTQYSDQNGNGLAFAPTITVAPAGTNCGTITAANTNAFPPGLRAG
ncbi:MAG: hypothetical protein HQL37_02920, partial [Alphaproteobacteria bacterium]|nr:hypothetical protein [Alphaproteobacteria bacterium]